MFQIQTEFSGADIIAIGELINKVACENMMVAEIGSWIGTSTIAIAKSIKKYDGKLFCIDHWQGNPGVVPHQVASKIDMFTVWKYNLVANGIDENVYSLKMDSETAAGIIADNTFDLIFIDADHSYDSVKRDIELWQAKVKSGGILCGHDFSNSHHELKKAVKEVIPDYKLTNQRELNYQIVNKKSSIWYDVK